MKFCMHEQKHGLLDVFPFPLTLDETAALPLMTAMTVATLKLDNAEFRARKDTSSFGSGGAATHQLRRRNEALCVDSRHIYSITGLGGQTSSATAVGNTSYRLRCCSNRQISYQLDSGVQWLVCSAYSYGIRPQFCSGEQCFLAVVVVFCTRSSCSHDGRRLGASRQRHCGRCTSVLFSTGRYSSVTLTPVPVTKLLH